MQRKALFRAPHLYDAGGDLKKVWWIEYAVRDPLDGKMKRKRDCGILNDIPNNRRRMTEANRMIEEIQGKLLTGWTPFDKIKDKVVYEDQIEYSQAAKIYGRKKEANRNLRFFASEYITLQKQTKAKKTYESYNGKIRMFVGWSEMNKMKDVDLSAFNHEVILLFFDWLIIEKKLAGKTVEKYRQTLSSLFKYFIERGLVKENPVGKVEIPEDKEDFSAVPFTDSDLKKILPVMRETDPQLFIASMLQYFCFIRPGNELLNLKIMHIDFERKKILIPKTYSKKRIERNIDLPEQILEILIEQGIKNYSGDCYLIGPFGKPGTRTIGMNTLRERFNTFRKNYGINHVYKWYSFKHTGAGRLLESGATIIELMNQLGHTDIASTYRYIRRHFGERSEHILNKFPSPAGF